MIVQCILPIGTFIIILHYIQFYYIQGLQCVLKRFFNEASIISLADSVLHCRVYRCLYRADHSVIIQLEKGIMQGWPVLLGNNTDKMDSMLRPIIQHHNTCLRDNAEKGGDSGCLFIFTIELPKIIICKNCSIVLFVERKANTKQNNQIYNAVK